MSLCKRVWRNLLLFMVFILIAFTLGQEKTEAATNDFQIKNGVLVKYLGDSSKVTIPSTVKLIGAKAFTSNTSVKSVTIPTSVTKISELAFFNCTNLSSIVIPKSVTVIGQRAFADCVSIKSLVLPDKLTRIEEETFAGCVGLKSITIPENVTFISQNAFTYCTSLTSLHIPDSVTCMDNAFNNCTSLESINIPKKVTSIGNFTFYNTGLTSIVIPDQVTSIGEWAFADCYKLKTVKISKNVSLIGNQAFLRCYALETIEFPDKLAKISEGICSDCTSLTTVSMADTVTSIGNGAFHGTKLTNFTLPASLTELGTSVFTGTPWYEAQLQEGSFFILDGVLLDASNCKGKVTVPKGVTEIADEAFRHSSAGEIILQEGVTKIGEYAFASSKIKKVTLPEGLKEIGESAFQESNIRSIDIPDSVTSIGAYAFCFCHELMSITIPEGITSLEERTFQHCTGLLKVSIPASVTTIGEYVFYNNNSLEQILVSADNPNYAGDGCFLLNKDKTKLLYCSSAPSEVKVPEGVEVVVSKAFHDCTFTKVSFPSTLKTLEDNAFYMCEELTEVSLPSSLTSFGKQLFQYCKNLRSFQVFDTDGDKNIASENGVLYSADKTTLICDPTPGSVIVSDGVTSISAFAFPNASISLTIPKSVTSIGEDILYVDQLYKPADEEPFHIYGYEGSYAEDYCTDNELSFLAYDATYTISYALDGGTNHKDNPDSYTYEASLIQLNPPTRKGYAFLYWYKDISICNDGCCRGELKVTSIPEKSLGNIELIAKWEKISVKTTVIQSAKKSTSTKARLLLQPVEGAAGYEIIYAKNSSLTSGKKVINSTVSDITLSNLTKGTTYYVKVRAYRLDSEGNKIYGSYSKVYKVK